jgi:predicted alpha/beta superfamily hydrolase
MFKTHLFTQRCAFLLFFLLTTAPVAKAQPVGSSLSTDLRNGEVKRSFHSQLLGEEQPYVLQLPEGFADMTSCRLLVLLDGDEYYGFARDIVHLYASAEKIHATAVLALPSSMQSRWKYYTPTHVDPPAGADAEDSALYGASGGFGVYARFIETELIPAIEREWNVSFGEKTLFGHSLGGLAAIHFLLDRPAVFRNYIVASPSVLWDKYAVLRTLEAEKDPQYTFGALYLTLAEDDMSGYEDRYFARFLKKGMPDDAQLTMLVNKGETHMTTGLRTLYNGILLLHGRQAEE